MMKIIGLFLLAVASVLGQAPTEVIGGGVIYAGNSTPNIMGDFFYAKNIANGTYSYTGEYITKVTLKPVSVVSQSVTGLAQYLKTINKVDLFALGAAGAAVTGSGSLGGSFVGGVMAVTEIKHNFKLIFLGNIIKSTVGGPVTGIVGINLGWGK